MKKYSFYSIINAIYQNGRKKHFLPLYQTDSKHPSSNGTDMAQSKVKYFKPA